MVKTIHQTVRELAGYDPLLEWSKARDGPEGDIIAMIANIPRALSCGDPASLENLSRKHVRLPAWLITSNHARTVSGRLAERVRQDWEVVLKARGSLLTLLATH